MRTGTGITTSRTREDGICLPAEVPEGLIAAIRGEIVSLDPTVPSLDAVGATDPLTFAGVALVLALVALGATYVPALRTARIDPVMAIQGESR